MAKAKENKDYKASGAKKWLIIVGILVLIAIIVVVIVLCIPANTHSAIERLKQFSQSSFLESETEQVKYSKVEQKIAASTIDYYGTELDDIRVLSDGINDVLDYYDEFLVLATDNKVLSKNYKTIKNNLEDAMDYQRSLNDYMNEISNLSDNSDSHLRNLWIDFRVTFTDYLSCMADVVDALNNCYQGCFDVNLANNLASTIILNTIDDYMSVIVTDFKEIVDTDKKNTTSRDYSYLSHGKITLMHSFVEGYIVDDSDIVEYNFSESLKSSYQKLNSFFELYNQDNLVDVIDSIETGGNITLTFQQEDSDGVYAAIKEFISAR